MQEARLRLLLGRNMHSAAAGLMRTALRLAGGLDAAGQQG